MSTNTPPEEITTQPSEGPKTAGVKPWRFESRPKNPIWVYKKGFISDRLITAWKDDRVEIGSYANPTYEELLNDWLCSDGSPCGHLPSSALASYYDNATQAGPITHHEASKEKVTGIPTVEELVVVYNRNRTSPLVGMAYPDGIAAVRDAMLKAMPIGGMAEFCREEREQGKGGCGACSWCCAQWKSRAESAEAQLASLKEKLEQFSDGAVRLLKQRDEAQSELDQIKELLPDESPCKHEVTGHSLYDDIEQMVREHEGYKKTLDAIFGMLYKAGIHTSNTIGKVDLLIKERDDLKAKLAEAKSALCSLQSEIIAQHKADMKAMEEKPWTLPAPPEGSQWQRDDWTQDMLPEGWRPLLKGEKVQEGDVFCRPDAMNLWLETNNHNVAEGWPSLAYWYRTRRPLPAPPTPKKRVPLTAADVPQGSILRPKEDTGKSGWYTILSTGDDGVRICREGEVTGYTWGHLMDHAIIKRPNEDWRPCSKEES